MPAAALVRDVAGGGAVPTAALGRAAGGAGPRVIAEALVGTGLLCARAIAARSAFRAAIALSVVGVVLVVPGCTG
jgi:hypothetical protein